MSAANPDPHDVRAAVRGDVAARTRVLTVVRPMILKYCRRRLSHQPHLASSAEDVTQEVCVALVAVLGGFDGRRPLMPFAYRIAANKLVDLHRAARRADRLMQLEGDFGTENRLSDRPDESPGPETDVLRADLRRDLRRCLRRLPSRSHEILVLRVALGLSSTEVALMIDSTPGAVRIAQHRALIQLRGLYGRQ